MARIKIKDVSSLTGKIHTEYTSKTNGKHIMYVRYLGGGSHIAYKVSHKSEYLDSIKRCAISSVGTPSQPISVYEVKETSGTIETFDLSGDLKAVTLETDPFYIVRKIWGIDLV